MRYRDFGQLDWKVSALGFGCMRLPTVDGNWLNPHVDETKAIHAIQFAIDAGVNYVDTAYPYHDGNSERVLGKALGDGYRDKVRVATKLPTWMMESQADFDRILNEQLRRLQTDYVDFYLLHALNRKWWRDIILERDILSRAEAALRDGRIGHLGFSFHDEAAVFSEILAGYDGWTFCQIQYNYMDTENQAGTAGLREAAARGLAVVVMEPLLGGRLANPPAAVREIFDGAPEPRSAADRALQWLWDQPEVSVVLSGMSSFDQVEANLASADRSAPGSLTTSERDLIERARHIYRERTRIPCTKCGYCQPCPNDVNIPANFAIYNDAFLHDDAAGARGWYRVFLRDGIRGRRADACMGCRACEERCPQQIPIADWMRKVDAFMEGTHD
jgi:uncharacterized protein